MTSIMFFANLFILNFQGHLYRFSQVYPSLFSARFIISSILANSFSCSAFERLYLSNSLRSFLIHIFLFIFAFDPARSRWLIIQ